MKAYRFSETGLRLHIYTGYEDGTALCGAYVDGQPNTSPGAGRLCDRCLRKELGSRGTKRDNPA